MTLRASFGKLVGAALAGSLLVVAAPAAAKPCHHHHHGGGNSEVSAYVENIPGPCGNQQVGGGHGIGHQGGGGSGTSGGGPGSTLPSSSAQQLQNLGPVGLAAARFAESTAPGFARHGGAGGQAGSNHAGNA